MVVEKNEISVDHIKRCCECNEHIFEGMTIYYMKINNLRENILLCEKLHAKNLFKYR